MASQVSTGDSAEVLGGASSIALDKDTGTTTGDAILLLISWWESGTNFNVNTPTGFDAHTQIAIDTSGGTSESRIALFTRISDGTEAATYPVSFTGNVFATGILMTMRGTGALSIASVTNGTRTTGTTCTAPDVAGSNGQILVAAMGTGDPTTMTTPPGMTAGTVGLQTANTGRFFWEALTGDVGTKASTLGTSRDNAAYSILLNDAGVGGGSAIAAIAGSFLRNLANN